jgi:PAS domain S-box-containing protein
METTKLTKISHDEKLDSEQLLTKLQTLQGYLEQQRLLHDISLMLSEEEDTDSFYRQVIKLAKTELGFDRLGLFLLDETQTKLIGTYGIDPNGELRKEDDIVIELAESEAGSERLRQLFSDKQRMLVAEDTDLFDNNEVAGRGWQITVPLWQENKPLGVIFADNLFTQKPLRPFEPNILSDYADTIANRISRMQAKASLRQSEQALQVSLEMQNTLHEINLELAGINDLDKLTQQTIILGREKLGFDRLGLWLIDDAKETMYGTYGVGPDGELRSEQGESFIIEDEPWIQDFVYEKERMTVREDDKLYEGTEGEQIGRGWHVIAALWAHGSPVGLFFADNHLSKTPLQPHQPELLSAYGANIATLINRMHAEKALKESEQSMQSFLGKMQDLHEISLQLSTIEDEQQMLREAFTLASTQLGFSRLGLFLLDPSHKYLNGTVGIGADGKLRDEFHIIHQLKDEPWMREFLFGKERLSVNEDIDLYEDDQVVGHGWNIVAALWIEDEPLGLLFTDNLLSKEPLKSFQPELLSSFGSTIANLIYKNRVELERRNTQAAIAKQAADLQTVADLSTQITTIQDPQILMDTIVQEAKARFDLYHAQIYLLDESNEKLDLAAGAGEAGKIMVGNGYHIQLSQEHSLVARAARTQKGVVANNVMMDPAFLPSPLLPETSSEMAVPMVVGDQVLGVFDVQANVRDRFSSDDVQIQMTLAAQIAVALQNARQYEQTQQALANAAIFRQLIDSASQGVHLTDLNGASIYVNPAFLKLHHHQFKNLEEELYGKELSLFYSEDIQERYNQEIIPTMLEKGSWEGELQFGDPENPTITYETYFLLRDKDGNVTHSAVIVSDITEQREREATIRANRNLMRSIIDSSPDWIIVKSRENQYMLVNQAFSDYNGIPVEDMIGKDDIEIGFDEELVKGNPEKGIPGFWPEDQAVMDSGEVFQKDDLLDDFGQTRYNSTVKTPLKDEDGNVIGLIVFVHDITPQKTAEINMAKRAEELQTVAELSTAVAATTDQQQLLQDVVDQTKERFDLYHAHIYLLDDSGRNLVLAAGAGDAGATMVKEGFSIPLDQEKSLVARAARTKKGVIVDDVTADPGFLPNKLLPDTRSEMAVPMIVGDNVLGVLDVQSTQVEGFYSEDVQIQSTLASQIAVALQNVRSLERSQQVVEELDALTRRLTRESWEDYLTAAEKEDMAFVYHLGELTTVENTDTGELEPETAVTPTNGHFSQSLLVHGEPIGHLTVFNDEESEQIDEDATLIMAAVAEQLSARVENLRLTEQTEFALAQTQEQAQRLGLLNEISAEMSNVETLNQVFNVIFARIPSLLKVDQVSLTMLQPDGETLELIGYEGLEMDMPIGSKIALLDTPMAQALHDNRVIANNEPSSDNKIQSSMIAPIYSSGRAIGTLNIGSIKTNALTNREETLLQQLATMLSSVIENKQLLAAAQARAERERQVRTITDKIRRGVDRETILNIAQKEIGKLIGAKQSSAQLGTKTQLLERIQQTIEQTKQGAD